MHSSRCIAVFSPVARVLSRAVSALLFRETAHDARKAPVAPPGSPA